VVYVTPLLAARLLEKLADRFGVERVVVHRASI
jgi:hypothetical protein